MLNPTRAAFARPGPGATPFPDVEARTQPSDSLVPIDRGSGLPLPWPTSTWMLLLCGATRVASAGRTRIHGRAARRRLITGSPLHRNDVEEERGPPRCLDRPLAACRGQPPRWVRPPCPTLGIAALAFKQIDALGTQNDLVFVAASPRPTRSHAYASPAASPLPSQGLLPAGRAHPLPRGACTRWTMNRIS